MTQDRRPAIVASLQAAAWACWIVALIARPKSLSELPPYQTALVPLLVSGLAWASLAMRSSSTLGRATAAVALGLLSSGIWFLAYVVTAVSIAFGAIMGPLFAIPIALVPIILFLVFGASMTLCRQALEALSSPTTR